MNTKDAGREGESMAEKKGNEEAPEATEKKAEDGSAEKEAAGTSPGPAPLGGGDQQPNLAAGSKVKTVGDEGDPGLDRGDQARRVSGREPAHGEDQEPES